MIHPINIRITRISKTNGYHHETAPLPLSVLQQLRLKLQKHCKDIEITKLNTLKFLLYDSNNFIKLRSKEIELQNAFAGFELVFITETEQINVK